jgi:hypothetical protein
MRYAFLLAVALAGSTAHAQPAEERMMSLTNAFRQSQSLATLASSPTLAAAAQEFVRYMARTGHYGHDADGRTPRERAQAHGYRSCLVSENIAFQQRPEAFTDQALAAVFIDGWKSSPMHRRNMLDPDVTEFAVAVAQDERTRRWYAVQLFGLPESARITFRLQNRADEPVTYNVDGAPFELKPGMVRTHERCRRPQVTMNWPGGQAPTRIEPRGSERYEVKYAQATGWRLERN